MSHHPTKRYRILHIFGQWAGGKIIDDKAVIIENDDGNLVDGLDGEGFFWRFENDEEFVRYLKTEEGIGNKEFHISSYFEYDNALRKIWWHWDSHFWQKVGATRHFYRTSDGVIGSKMGQYACPKSQQFDCSDDSIRVVWSIGRLGWERGRVIKNSQIEDLVIDGEVLHCDCPFCGQPEQTKIEKSSLFYCSNCRHRWRINDLK